MNNGLKFNERNFLIYEVLEHCNIVLQNAVEGYSELKMLSLDKGQKLIIDNGNVFAPVIRKKQNYGYGGDTYEHGAYQMAAIDKNYLDAKPQYFIQI